MNVKIVGSVVLLSGLIYLFFFERQDSQPKDMGEKLTASSQKPHDGPTNKAVVRDAERSGNGYVQETRQLISNLTDEAKSKIYRSWSDSVAKNGFKEQDFRFGEGLVRSNASDPDKRQTVFWQDLSGSCKLEMEMINLVPQDVGRVSCSR